MRPKSHFITFHSDHLSTWKLFTVPSHFVPAATVCFHSYSQSSARFNSCYCITYLLRKHIP